MGTTGKTSSETPKVEQGVYTEGSREAITDQVVARIVELETKRLGKLWGDTDYDISRSLRLEEEDAREWVDKFFEYIDYLKYRNQVDSNDLIETHTEDDGYQEVVWKFSGTDKETGNHASFEFLSGWAQYKAREDLKFNGYGVRDNLVLPKNVFNYLVDRTDADLTDRRNASSLAAVLLDMKRKSKK